MLPFFANLVCSCWRFAITLLLMLSPFISSVAQGGETDQFLTGNIELEDSAEALNAFLDQDIRSFVGRANRKTRPATDAVVLTEDLYRYLFQGLHASRVRR